MVLSIQTIATSTSITIDRCSLLVQTLSCDFEDRPYNEATLRSASMKFLGTYFYSYSVE